jgi:hypothetical protein
MFRPTPRPARKSGNRIHQRRARGRRLRPAARRQQRLRQQRQPPLRRGEIHPGNAGRPVAYIHIAGHYNEAPDLIVDSHGAAVIDVWKPARSRLRAVRCVADLLERDFNIPALSELVGDSITSAQSGSPPDRKRCEARPHRLKPKHDRPAARALQYRFTAHIRDQNNPPPEGIEDRRMAIYRDLVCASWKASSRRTFR